MFVLSDGSEEPATVPPREARHGVPTPAGDAHESPTDSDVQKHI